jgi:hypothetical protein
MAEFDTTKMTQNAPGLTYATPKAMPAKYSSLAGAASLVDTAVKSAVAFDKANVLEDAREEAAELSKMYKDGSITNQQFLLQQKEETEANLATAPSGEKQQYQIELDEINDKLSLMKEQGVISPEEFKMRLLTKTTELTNNNPVYANEIAKEVSSIMGNTGINDLISMDSSYYTAQAKAQAAQMKVIDDTLKDYGISVLLPTETKIALYQQITDVTSKVAGLKLMSESSEAISSYEFEQSMIEDGGIHVVGGQVKQDYYGKMQRNINDPNKSEAEKQKRHIELVAEARNILSATLSKLPVKPQYTAYFNQAIQDLTDMETDLSKVLSGEFEKNYFANQAATASAKAQLQERLEGRSPEKIENIEKLLGTLYTVIDSKYLADDAGALKLYESNTQALIDAINSRGGKSNINLNYNQPRMNSNLTGSLPLLNTEGLKLIDAGENLDALGTEYNDILQQSTMITNLNDRLQDLDVRLNKLALTTDSKIFENLLNTNPDFRELNADAINTYTVGILQEAESYPDVINKLMVNKNTGRVRTTDLQDSLGNVVNRLNVLIQYESKLLGKKPGETADEVINRLFKVKDIENVTSSSTVEAITDDEQAVLDKYK